MATKSMLALITVAAIVVASCSSTNSTPTAPAAAGTAPATTVTASAVAGTAAATAVALPTGPYTWGGCDSVPPQQTLTIAMPGDDPTLDPHFSQNQISNEVNYNINDQFVRYGTKPGANGVPVFDPTNILGWSAGSWQWSTDGTTLTLNVRPGQVFHGSGNPVTAADFVYFLNRAQAIHPSNVTLAGLTAAKQTSTNQLELTFSKPFSPLFFFLFRDQQEAPLDSLVMKANATTDDPWSKTYAAAHDQGSGPYYVASWNRGVEMDLCANPAYQNGQPYFKRVVLKVVPSDANRVLLLKQGSVDIAETLTLDDTAGLQNASGVQVISEPTRDQMDLGFNNQTAPFNNVLVRQALAYATPYPSIVQSIYNGQAQLSKGPIPVGGQYFNGSSYPYTYDLTKAKQLLTQAGMANGFDFTVSIMSGDTQVANLAVLLQSTYKQIGVNMQIQQQTPAVFAQAITAHTQQAWIRDVLSYVDDPAYIGFGFYTSKGCCNWANYQDTSVAQLVTQMLGLQNTGADQQTKQQLTDQFQQTINAAVPMVNLAQTNFQLAMRSDISGYVQGPDNLISYMTLTRK
jgi:peptide/nickel transport system substrate-binding protein